MKYFYIFFIFLSFFFLTCSKETENIETRDGIIYEEDAVKPFTGRVTDVVDNKRIEYDVVDGKKHGEFKIYFENGNLEMIGYTENNLNEGHWKYFYPSGNIESEGNFENDKPEGEWKWFYENGVIKEKVFYEKGEKKGKWILYNENGQIIDEKILE